MTLMVLDAQGIADGALPVAELAAQMRLADDYDTVPGQAERLRLRLRAAISTVERQTGKALIARDFTLSGSAAQTTRVAVTVAPLVEVHVVRTIRAGMVQDVPIAEIQADAHRPVIVLASAPADGARLEVLVRAGFGAWSDVPDGLAQAVLLIAEGLDQGDGQSLIPTATRLMAPWRPLRIGGGTV